MFDTDARVILTVLGISLMNFFHVLNFKSFLSPQSVKVLEGFFYSSCWTKTVCVLVASESCSCRKLLLQQLLTQEVTAGLLPAETGNRKLWGL